MIANNPKVIMTSDEFIRRLKVLASRNTFYKNKWNYNLGLVAPAKAVRTFQDCRGKIITNYNPKSTPATSFDCSNLMKCIFNGYNVDNTNIGYYQTDLSNTGDCTEAELLAQCTDVSQDFKTIKAPAILYMKGHIGAYIGITPDNRFNVIECTSIWGGGVIYSWVDQDGTRRSENGGKPVILTNGTYQRWTHYGYPTKWVSFNGQVVTQTPTQTQTTDYSKLPMIKKGATGDDVRKLQELLSKKGYNAYGDFGSECDKAVRKFQKDNGLEVDGIVGPKTWGALYK